MATIGHRFKKALLSYDALSQREILDNIQAEAMRRDETAFYTWVQQICFARMNALNDREFADNTLWNELIKHLESPILRYHAVNM